MSNFGCVAVGLLVGAGYGQAFEVHLDYSPAPALFTALQERLGLRLESRKSPAEVLIVDHAERPSGN